MSLLVALIELGTIYWESPLHAAGYVLHPLWTANDQEIDHDLQMGWMKTVMLYASGNIVLQNALLDEFYYAYKNKHKICFKFHLQWMLIG